MIETQVEQKVQVEKRDGRVTDFDPANIINAVKAAYGDISKPYGPQEEQTARELAARVEAELKDRCNGPAKIEDVQTFVEQSLVNSHMYDVAKAYTEYRLNRDIERAKSTDINYAVKRLVDRDESIVKENANKDSNVYSTQRDLLAGAVSKATAFQMLPKAVANAHMKGDIHFHDADYSPFTAQTNCLARETRFVTDRGVRSFEDYEDGDRVNALTPSGTFRESVVRSYGMRKLDEITFSNGVAERKVQATGNHRWLLRDGRVTTTLQVGDVLEAPAPHRNVLVTNPTGRILHAWVQGFAYDRGITFEWPDTDVCTVRLADYEREYAHAFDNLGYKAFSVDGDGIEYHLNTDDMACDLSHMGVDETNAFCEGFMASMNASDTITTNGKADSRRIVERYLPTAGYHIQSAEDKTGREGVSLREYHLLDPEGEPWKVVHIEHGVRGQQVWCLEVPEEHAFVLEGGIVTGNCSLPNYWDMLANGFTLGNAPMGSPNSISIAATQITQIMKDVAASQYGGQTANRADEHLAEYAKKDYAKFLEQAEEIMPDDLPVEIAERQVASAKKTEPERLHFEKDRPALPMDEPFSKGADRLQQLREIWAKIQTRKAIYDAMQTMEYQINSNRVSNGQTPFVTVGFGLGTDWFAREIQRAIFLNRIRGLGSEHHTAIFPKLVFTIKHGVNADPGDPNYDMKQLALECATKRMYPDVIFYENIVKITGSFKAPMGCRSFLQGWTDPKTGKDVEDGRMNLGVVTVNIPRIALESRGDKKRFWRLFGERMRVAHQALQFRINRCKQAMPINAPTLFRYGAFGRLSASDNVDQLFRDERATVSLGYIGLYEATSVFYGKDWMRDHSWDPEGKEFALEIVKRMNRLCRKWSREEGYHYSVYSTPAESLTDRFNRMDREKFGRVEGVTDHDFYTNSFHYPVWLSPTPFEKLDYEKDFPYYASGGFINYCEFPCLQANPKALEAVWDYAYQIGIGYLGTNTPIDTCYVCGYQGDFEPTEEGFKCPECGNSDPDKCNVTKRTCGYLGNPVQRPMVHGRHEEIAHRVKHMGGETGHVTLQDGSEREWFEDEGKTFTTVER